MTNSAQFIEAREAYFGALARLEAACECRAQWPHLVTIIDKDVRKFGKRYATIRKDFCGKRKRFARIFKPIR